MGAMVRFIDDASVLSQVFGGLGVEGGTGVVSAWAIEKMAIVTKKRSVLLIL